MFAFKCRRKHVSDNHEQSDSGAALSSGAWLCFDEMQSLTIECLSIVAEQILEFQRLLFIGSLADQFEHADH